MDATDLYTEAHAVLHVAITQAAHEEKQARAALDDATGPEWRLALLDYTRAMTRHTTLVEAGLIFSLDTPKEN